MQKEKVEELINEFESIDFDLLKNMSTDYKYPENILRAVVYAIYKTIKDTHKEDYKKYLDDFINMSPKISIEMEK